MIKGLAEDKEVQALLKKPTLPTLDDIRPLFDRYNVDSAMKVWDMFDSIRELWLNKKSYDDY
jgi:hypothetical protein